MKIREMEKRDYGSYCTLLREVHGIHAEKRPDIFRSEAFLPDEAEFEALIADAETVCLAAEEDGGMIGMCIMEVRCAKRAHVHHRPYGWIDDLCVRSDLRSRGVGTKLYRAMKERAEAMGLARLELMVWAFNEDALRFYERSGMKVRSFTMEEALHGENDR